MIKWHQILRKRKIMLFGYRYLHSSHKNRRYKVIRSMKDELCQKITTMIVALRSETYNYLKNNSNKKLKSKRHQKVYDKTRT